MINLDIRYYLAVFVHRLPVFVAVAVTVAFVGVALAYLLPPVYRAPATIMVETPQIPTDLARSTVPSNTVEQVQLIERELTTRANLLALSERFDIYHRRPEMSQGDMISDMRARVRIDQVRFDTGNGSSGVRAFDVSFKSNDARMSADMANALAAFILQNDARLRSGRAADTLTFFQTEVTRLAGELKRIEAQILDFKNDNLEALPDSLSFRRSLQSSHQERLMLLQREEASLRSRRATLIQIFEMTGRLPNAGPKSLEEASLERLQQALVDQSATFAENSPAITALRARITTVKAQLSATATGKSPASSSLPPSDLQLQVADVDERLKTITAEKATISDAFFGLTRSIAATPANETALHALERNYRNTQIQYDAAVAGLAEASTGKQIEQHLKGERLSLMEAAIPPESPSGPGKLMIAALGGLGGIAAGLGMVVLLEMVRRSVRRPADLEAALDITPLMTIPYIRTDGEITRRRLVAAAAVVVMITVIPAVHAAMDHADIHLQSVGDKAMRKLGILPVP